jgi:hypothetical protein
MPVPQEFYDSILYLIRAENAILGFSIAQTLPLILK